MKTMAARTPGAPARGAKAQAALASTRPFAGFAASFAGQEAGTGVSAGHEFGRVDVRAAGEAGVVQRVPAWGAPAGGGGASRAASLPPGLLAGIQRLSGRRLDGVSVHYDSPRPAAVQAEAFAQGRQIHLAPGADHHLPHEAWHVVQQMQGRVRPTLRLGGKGINDQESLEREATWMGAHALSRAAGAAAPSSATSPEAPIATPAAAAEPAAPVQRAPKVNGTTVVAPGSQHHNQAKNKRIPKSLGKKQNLAAQLQLSMLQNPNNQLSKKDLARVAKTRAKGILKTT